MNYLEDAYNNVKKTADNTTKFVTNPMGAANDLIKGGGDILNTGINTLGDSAGNLLNTGLDLGKDFLDKGLDTLGLDMTTILIIGGGVLAVMLLKK